MRVCDAVKTRMNNLLKENNLSINSVCTKGFMTTSTLNSMLNNKSEYCSMKTITKFCQGVGISVFDFYNDDLFKCNDEEVD
ncbi:MAG: hypothetical protein E7378_04270 [Clostridiales bacterium]|nr:hypothetical protein [Clostridiales bacterium]